ncbi:FKBP-type peptidyl-prolyl cis-trans isomerase [Belliella baltica DSM 15883]|uniref:Peptidyl-prolyl cis-trans isomerase n=1 Tax=Belliella baltica (strain DSM 15883 / CIP 108006 / LMG 21964 / BA134) TaxID=866536 RepID=I3Z4D4_BELBD|nr:FKBP-type peptidyl-prolyl cis-trans isomerase [Belliella baltica]AFL84102.1 FKBP-type peptidyl-prolyl cis-trans isomerase [Belliella baltica DSM 15883]
MKRLSVGILSFFFLMTGCISDQENTEVVLEKDKQAIEKYIADNNVTGVKEFRDETLGFVFIWQEVSGSGLLPTSGDTILVNYTGKFLNDLVFDTSLEDVARENNIYNQNRAYEPLLYRFDRGTVIPGFDFAISKMEEGDKMIAFIPSLYAYGPAGSPPRIPGNTPLIFELEFLPAQAESEDDE